LLPFFELLDYSRRQQNIFAAIWPMPVSGWANFLAPLFHCSSYQGVFVQPNQTWINSYYVGAATVALGFGALWQRGRHRYVWPLALLAGLCLVLALGEASPIYVWLARHFDFVSLMRYPIKFVILPVFLLPLRPALASALEGWSVAPVTTMSMTMAMTPGHCQTAQHAAHHPAETVAAGSSCAQHCTVPLAHPLPPIAAAPGGQIRASRQLLFQASISLRPPLPPPRTA